MRLSDIKGEAALDAIADLIEPITEILSDSSIEASYRDPNQNNAQLISLIIKNHKQAVIDILAILDGENPDEYVKKINLFTVPVKLMEIINDPEMKSLFPLQARQKTSESFGPAMVNTQEKNQ